MTDPDRLAEIKAWIAEGSAEDAGVGPDVLWLVGEDMLWLVGEVERLRDRVSLMAKQLLEADGLVEVDRLRELLARLQWAGTHCERDRELAACPVCGVLADSEVVGQLPHVNCWLADELRTERLCP